MQAIEAQETGLFNDSMPTEPDINNRRLESGNKLMLKRDISDIQSHSSTGKSRPELVSNTSQQVLSRKITKHGPIHIQMQNNNDNAITNLSSNTKLPMTTKEFATRELGIIDGNQHSPQNMSDQFRRFSFQKEPMGMNIMDL